MTSLPAPGFSANFTSTHSVVIDHPIHIVFPALATAEGIERTIPASSLWSNLKLLEHDTVSIPESLPLAESSFRHNLSAEGEIEEGNRPLPRQHFTCRETVTFLGPIKTGANIRATLTWDEQAKTSLYESYAGSIVGSALVWRFREFQEEGGTKTRITECIRGKCPGWLRGFVLRVTTRSQKENLGNFHTLFETDGN